MKQTQISDFFKATSQKPRIRKKSNGISKSNGPDFLKDGYSESIFQEDRDTTFTDFLDNDMNVLSESESLSKLGISTSTISRILGAESRPLDNNMSIDISDSDSELNYFVRKITPKLQQNKIRNNFRKANYPKRRIARKNKCISASNRRMGSAGEKLNGKSTLSEKIMKCTKSLQGTSTATETISTATNTELEYFSTDFLTSEKTVNSNPICNTPNEASNPDKTSFVSEKTVTSKQKIHIISIECVTPPKKNQEDAGIMPQKININKQESLTKTVSVQSENIENLPVRLNNSLEGRKLLNMATQTNPEELRATAVISREKTGNKETVPRKNVHNSDEESVALKRMKFPKKKCISRELSSSDEEITIIGPSSSCMYSSRFVNKSNLGKTPPKKTDDTAKGTTPSKQFTLTQCTSKVTVTKRLENFKDEKGNIKLAIEVKEDKKGILKNITETGKRERYTRESHKRICENVRQIVHWVFENEYFRILFLKRESDLLRQLFDLPNEEYITVCLRLFTRQHKWYNVANLCKELNLKCDGLELRNLSESLREHCLVDTDYSREPVHILIRSLSKADIKDICKAFRLKVPNTKSAMIIALLDNAVKQTTLNLLKTSTDILRKYIADKMGLCIRLSSEMREILHRVHILYSFSNSEIENTYNIYDLMYKLESKSITFPQVTIQKVKLFDRQNFLRFVEAYKIRSELQEEIVKKDTRNQFTLCTESFKRLEEILANAEILNEDSKKPLFLRRFSAGWLYCNILSQGSQNLGKQFAQDVREWLDVMLNQHVYCPHKRGFWYNQMAIIKQTHLKDIMGAVKYITDGITDKSVSEVARHELSIRGSKIKKPKLQQMELDNLRQCLLPSFDPVPSRTVHANVVHNNETGRKKVYVRNTSNGKEYSSVENTAINFYLDEGLYTNGIHCEGQLFQTLFFILFWDIIYNSESNTFFTKLQCFPLDLFSGEFYSNHVDKINARISDIRDTWNYDTLCYFISTIMKNNSEEITSLVNSGLNDEQMLHTFVRCIGKKVLAAVCQRLAKHFKQFRSGVPDLFLWNSKELKACFVEVKSEKDTLSTNQILWLNYLKEFGAKVEVCHVKSIGSNVRKNN